MWCTFSCSCSCLSIYLSMCKLENEAILRDFLSFLTGQHQKRSNSLRFLQFFELDNIKNEAILRDFLIFRSWHNIKNAAILRDFLQKWKVQCRADGLVPIRSANFPFHLSKVLHLPRKSEARSYEVLHLSRKVILANLKIWCSKMQPRSRTS